MLFTSNSHVTRNHVVHICNVTQHRNGKGDENVNTIVCLCVWCLRVNQSACLLFCCDYGWLLLNQTKSNQPQKASWFFRIRACALVTSVKIYCYCCRKSKSMCILKTTQQLVCAIVTYFRRRRRRWQCQICEKSLKIQTHNYNIYVYWLQLTTQNPLFTFMCYEENALIK